MDPLQCNHASCDNEIDWNDGVWNEDHWEFRNCYSCVGLTSRYCGENGGSCCNSLDPGFEDEGNPVFIPEIPMSWLLPNGDRQMPHGFVCTPNGIVNVMFPYVYSPLRYICYCTVNSGICL